MKQIPIINHQGHQNPAHQDLVGNSMQYKPGKRNISPIMQGSQTAFRPVEGGPNNKKLVNVNLSQLRNKEMISSSAKEMLIVNQSRKAVGQVSTMPIGSLEASFDGDSVQTLDKNKKTLPA